MPALIIAGFFGIWQIAAMLLDSPLLPTFSAAAVNLFTSEGLFLHLIFSLMRMVSGLLLAALAGLPLGIIAGRSKKGSFISLPSYLLHPVPKTLFIPLILLLLGIGEMSKIILVALSIIFQIILSTRDAVKAVPEEYYTSINTLSSNRAAELRWVTLPSALPSLFSTLRVSLGIAAAVLFFAEYFGTEHGMGFYIMDARTRINFNDLYSGILALSLMMLSLFRLLRFIESRLCRWRFPSRIAPRAGLSAGR